LLVAYVSEGDRSSVLVSRGTYIPYSILTTTPSVSKYPIAKKRTEAGWLNRASDSAPYDRLPTDRHVLHARPPDRAAWHPGTDTLTPGARGIRVRDTER
jgi:hypothetical protein